MIQKTMIVLSSLLALGGVARAETSAADAARADIARTLGFVPSFLKAVPDNALPGAWAEMKQFSDADTALPTKIKDLIGLAVAAQVPSRASVYVYTRCAQANGASDAEVKEAVTVAALTRHWSTYLNGVQIDEAKFRGETGMMTEYVAKMAAGKVPPPRPMVVTDARSAADDIKQYFGLVPEFLKSFPPEALPGAWTEEKSVEIGESALPGKYKSLVSLAVASQIPCRYCVVMDTEFAKLDGATAREIHEAIAMAAVARHWMTLADGLQLDEKTLRRDIDRLLQGAARPRMARSGR
jgi:AhpD family alkylhydroperoxidase